LDIIELLPNLENHPKGFGR